MLNPTRIAELHKNPLQAMYALLTNAGEWYRNDNIEGLIDELDATLRDMWTAMHMALYKHQTRRALFFDRGT